MEIRRLRKKDLQSLKQYWKVYEPFLRRYDDMKEGDSLFLIVWKGNIPIGHGRIIWRNIPVIEDMFIENKYRSKGIGTKLLKRLELYIERKNHNKIRLYVDPKNRKAERLYLRKGYKLTGRVIKDKKEMLKII